MSDFNYDGFFSGLGATPDTYSPPQTYGPVEQYSTPNVPFDTGGGGLLNTSYSPPPATFDQSVQQNIASDPLMTYVYDVSNAVAQMPYTPIGAPTAGAKAGDDEETWDTGQSFGSQAIDWFKQSIGWQDATADNPKPDNSLQLALLNMGGSAIAGGLTNVASSRKAQSDADLARYNAETNRRNVDANIESQKIIDQKNLKDLNKYKNYGNFKMRNLRPITGKMKFN